MSKHQAVLDFPLLNKWCDHHRGKAVDDPYFVTILMGVFLEGGTPEVEGFLNRFSQFYDSSLFDNLIRISDETVLQDPVEAWVHADLKAKRNLFVDAPDGATIVKLIDNPQIHYAETRTQWWDALTTSENHSLAYDIVGEYVSEHVHAQNLSDLVEPLYHICNSYELVHSILAKAMQCTIDFSNYLEVYLRGADYLFENDSILVIKHADAG